MIFIYAMNWEGGLVLLVVILAGVAWFVAGAPPQAAMTGELERQRRREEVGRKHKKFNTAPKEVDPVDFLATR
jgi:hypothetical protein